MDSIGVFTPEQARLLWQEYLSRQQLQSQLTKNYPQRRPLDEPSPHRVFVKNTSGEAIPAFACMQITGTAVYGERTVVNVTKPTTTDGVYLFNSPYEIAIDAAGWAYRFGVVVMLGVAPSEVNAAYQPIVGSWEIEEGGGPFTVFGTYEITPESTTAALIGRFGSAAGGGETIRFEIYAADCDNRSAVVQILSSRLSSHNVTDSYTIDGQTEVNELGETVASRFVAVYDKAGCYLNESNRNLRTRVGYAAYVYGRPLHQYDPWWSWEVIALCEQQTTCEAF